MVVTLQQQDPDKKTDPYIKDDKSTYHTGKGTCNELSKSEAPIRNPDQNLRNNMRYKDHTPDSDTRKGCIDCKYNPDAWDQSLDSENGATILFASSFGNGNA